MPGLLGKLESINRSSGGVPKSPVVEARIDETGLEGDRQRDRRFHGGPDRAIVLFSWDVIQALQDEGHPVDVGTAGENLTVSDLDWSRVVPGTELRVGEVHLQVTKYTSPCAGIAGSFLDGDVSRISQKRHAGWSRVCARVLAGGIVRVRDTVEIVEHGPA